MEDKALAPQPPHLYMLAWGLPWSVLSVSGLSVGLQFSSFLPHNNLVATSPDLHPSTENMSEFLE